MLKSANEKKRINKKILFVALALIVIVIVAIVAVSLYNQSTDLTIVRVTIVLTLNEQTSTQVVVQPNAEGKIPVGDDFTISYPFYNSEGSGQMSLTNVESQTNGFTFVSSNPSLPVVAPSSGSTIVVLQFTTPTTAYSGPFDYTIYYTATS